MDTTQTMHSILEFVFRHICGVSLLWHYIVFMVWNLSACLSPAHTYLYLRSIFPYVRCSKSLLTQEWYISVVSKVSETLFRRNKVSETLLTTDMYHAYVSTHSASRPVRAQGSASECQKKLSEQK